MSTDAINRIARHVVTTDFADLPKDALDAAKKFILDSIGVGLAGGSGPWVDQLIAAHQLSSTKDNARVLGQNIRLNHGAAAMCNAYQIHNAEFDCVHEEAVVHPLTVVLSACLAEIDRVRSNNTISGEQLIRAITLGVDVACHLGVASVSPLKFFRPGTCGAFGATASLAVLRGFDTDQLLNAFGMVHSQLCGTMQAHTEGSPLLAMQMGFNARNAMTACDLAGQGIPGTRNTLEGQFGFYALFEGEHCLESVMPQVGRVWRITEVAHKPYPSGRATHGIIDACMKLRDRHFQSATSVHKLIARVPPLTHHLVGRPVNDEMDINYARLCARFVAARVLIAGNVVTEDFSAVGRHNRETLELAARIEIEADSNPNPNALSPIKVVLENKDGSKAECEIKVIYGNPAKPMNRKDYLHKFRSNWKRAASPLSDSACERVIEQIEALPEITDCAAIIDDLVP